MLGKLMNQEIKATSRLLIPTYLVLLVISIFDRIFYMLQFDNLFLYLIKQFVQIGYFIALFALLAITAILLVYRFYKNYLTDEGYLMFTLPVKTNHLVISKLIVAFGYSIVSILLCLISLFIAYGSSSNLEFIKKELETAYHQAALYNISLTTIITILILLFISTIIANILNVYASISLGQLYTKHKLLGSFIAYMAIYTIIQFIGIIAICIAGLIFKFNYLSQEPSPELVLFFFIFGIISNVILSVVYYFITCYMFKKRLNLD